MLKEITFLGLLLGFIGCSGAQPKFIPDVFRDECLNYAGSLKGSVPSQEYFTALFAINGIHAVSLRTIDEDVAAADAKAQQEVERDTKKVKNIKLARKCIRSWTAVFNNQKTEEINYEDYNFVISWGLYVWTDNKQTRSAPAKGTVEALSTFFKNNKGVVETPKVDAKPPQN